MNIEFQKISHRALNPMQRRALRRVFRYVDQRYVGRNRTRFDLQSCGEGRLRSISCVFYAEPVSDSVATRILMEKRVHVSIGPRGKLIVLSASLGLSDWRKEAKRALR